MVASPGTLQSSFTSGEHDPHLGDRDELKYYNTGASYAANVEIIPQGGFRVRAGLRDIGELQSDAARLFSFTASDGSAYDIVLAPGEAEAWGATGKLQTFSTNVTADMLGEIDAAQQLDTMILFHRELEPERIKHEGPTSWSVDKAPLEDIPTYDYGADYDNGVSAAWHLEFVGLETGSVFNLTISNQETESISWDTDTEITEAAIQAAIDELPNVAEGVSVSTLSDRKFRIEFNGDDNLGDDWAVSGTVINKSDAAVIAFKKRVGVAPGEAVISDDRGWPSCGTFYSQRLIMGGLGSLPNAWMMSTVGDYYNFDDRFTEANGPALIPMDVKGGERILQIVKGRNLQFFTTEAEYWLAERTLSKTEAPNHVEASRHGTRPGVPIVENEGAAVFAYGDGGVLGEFRYLDTAGNFQSLDISLLASHLIDGVKDLAQRPAAHSTDGNMLAVVKDDGSALQATLLRQQDVTAFSRLETDGTFHAVCRNGRKEISWIVERPGGMRLERTESGLLLDEAYSQTFDSETDTIPNLTRFNGREVWCIADDHVLGPYSVTGGSIALPVAVLEATVGTWKPPVVTTLPPSRRIGPNIVMKRKVRIHSVVISVLDTTSIAISANGGSLKDIDLIRYGAEADVPELQAPYSGQLKIRGLRGYEDEPTITISQVRPGRMTVRSVTLSARL